MFLKNLSSLLLNALVLHLVVSLIAFGKQLNSLGLKFMKLSVSPVFIRWDMEVGVFLLHVLPNLGWIQLYMASPCVDGIGITPSKIFQVQIMQYLSLIPCRELHSKLLQPIQVAQLFVSSDLLGEDPLSLCRGTTTDTHTPSWTPPRTSTKAQGVLDLQT